MSEDSNESDFGSEARKWEKASWRARYSYTFTWLGRPIIQLPDDMIRLQEAIFALQPDVIVETGVAHGGSLIYSASLCKLIGKGRVIGVDVEIRPHNRRAIESHFLSPLISLVEGSSIDPQIVAQVRSHVQPGERVMVILDSCHEFQHVRSELAAYAPMVSAGSYIVATDGIMKDLVGIEGAQPDWETNNPHRAAREFAEQNPEFILGPPAWTFDESRGLTPSEVPTYWPGAWIKRRETVAS